MYRQVFLAATVARRLQPLASVAALASATHAFGAVQSPFAPSLRRPLPPSLLRSPLPALYPWRRLPPGAAHPLAPLPVVRCRLHSTIQLHPDRSAGQQAVRLARQKSVPLVWRLAPLALRLRPVRSERQQQQQVLLSVLRLLHLQRGRLVHPQQVRLAVRQ